MKKLNGFKKSIVFILSMMAMMNISAQNPVAEHGFLKVKGNKIVGEKGEEVQLRGMSLCWTQWFGKHYNYQTIEWLKDDWKCDVVRAAMAVELDGYLVHPDMEQMKIETVVNAAIDNGMYVIIDWHDHHAQRNVEAAKRFFGEMAGKYGLFPNIIYEVYNEPLQISWKDSIKPYCEAVITEIRKQDKRNLIICGTPTWSQDVEVAAADPIKDENVAYAMHFYAATHKQYLRDKTQKALDMGVAIFVSEFGTCDASGRDPYDFEETKTWLKFCDDNKLSYCNWGIYDKKEAASALLPGKNSFGGWNSDILTPSGKFIRAWLRKEALPVK
jgi:endoglucanase